MRYTSLVSFDEAPNLHHHGFDEFETSHHVLKAYFFIHNIQLTQTHAVQSQSFPNVYKHLAMRAATRDSEKLASSSPLALHYPTDLCVQGGQ